MYCISLWQPWASLLVHGFKKIETRGWAAPRRLIGQRIGIASTKSLKALQKLAYEDPDFQQFYSETGLDELEDLPMGYLLGSVVLKASVPMDQALVKAISIEEYRFGDYTEGRHAWHVIEPEAFKRPIPVRGAQGIWEVPDSVIEDAKAKTQDRARAPRPTPRPDHHHP